MEYRLNPLIGSGNVRHVVGPEGLVLEREKFRRREVIPFSSIRAIHLRQEAPGKFTLRVVARGAETITIPSRHMRGLAQFDERGPEYRCFALELIRASHAANPHIRFIGGSSLLFVMGWGLLGIGALSGATATWLALTSSPSWPIVLGTATVLTMGWSNVRSGRGTPFDPDAPPESLLPPDPDRAG